MLKKMAQVIAVVLMVVLMLIGAKQASDEKKEPEEVGKQMSQSEQLKDRLLTLGDNATISSDEDMEALWTYFVNNDPIRDIVGNPKWQIAENCYLTILEGRGAIKLADGDITIILKFTTTIDCPKSVEESDISLIVCKSSKQYDIGTYTDKNSKRWILGKQVELQE